MFFRRRKRKDGGAALVEFAFVMPFLLFLLLGIVEFGYVFGVYNDVRHGAREGARFAAVDAGDNLAIQQYICNTMEPLGGGINQLDLDMTQNNINGAAGIQIGDSGTLVVTAHLNSLSGVSFVEVFLPAQLRSEIEFRIEQGSPPSWSGFTVANVIC